MTVRIRAQIRSEHSKGNMLGSNVGETSEQTCRREIEPIARGRDMEKGMKDVREQMQNLHKGMLV